MIITIRAGIVAIGLCLLLFAVGCSREQQDWRSAEAADTIEGYGEFIQRHPESELAAEARTRVTQLGEDHDWRRAGSADTADAYRQFIAQHPNGKWAQEARIRIENFALGAQAAEAGVPRAAAGSAEAPVMAQATIPTAASQANGSTGFAVQLGAFGSEAGANHEWSVLIGRLPAELQGLSARIVSADTPAGRLYRLQAAVADGSRARAVCDVLKKHAQACVPVLPH